MGDYYEEFFGFKAAINNKNRVLELTARLATRQIEKRYFFAQVT